MVGYFHGSLELEVILGGQDIYDLLTIDSSNCKVIHVHGDLLVYFVLLIEAHPYIRFSLARRESDFT